MNRITSVTLGVGRLLGYMLMCVGAFIVGCALLAGQLYLIGGR